ncbi:MAG: calcium-binding protein, partial [Burkholderiales bacterium]
SGVAHVTWYDRRTAEPGGTLVSNNSLTDFFGASAFLDAGGNLTPGTEFQVNEPGTADAQCEAGFPTGSVQSWPAIVDQRPDSESCSLQPQLGGQCCVPGDIDGSNRCLNPSAASSQQRCDFDQTACPAGEQCAASRGSPKYGDYNGNACAAGRIYIAWASATAPGSIGASADIDLFFSAQDTCFGKLPTIAGTSGNDALLGTSGDDVINGAGGNDDINGRGGNDLICGGDGRDRINTGAGNDKADGGAGNDEINGGAGNDTLNGGAGDDAINGGSGDDSLDGGDDFDRLNGGPDTDTCVNGELIVGCP